MKFDNNNKNAKSDANPTEFTLMPKRTRISFFIPMTLFSFYLATMTCQTKIVVNEDDMKYVYNPFTEFTIKPMSFKDGKYIFYIDDSLKYILFEGEIKNGVENGVYHTYKRNKAGEINSKAKTSIKSINGKLDGIGIIDISECGYRRDGFHFHFNNGALKKIDIINPFFRGELLPQIDGGGFYNKRDSLKPIDTLTFLFQNGKLESVHFYNNNSFYIVQPALKNDCVKDTLALKKLSTSEKYYVRNPEFKDSLGIVFEKIYEFRDTTTNWQKSIFIGYDSLKTLNLLSLISGFPTVIYEKIGNYYGRDNFNAYRIFLLEMEFDKNKFLSLIKYNQSFTELASVDENGIESTNLYTNPSTLYFLPDGILDISK